MSSTSAAFRTPMASALGAAVLLFWGCGSAPSTVSCPCDGDDEPGGDDGTASAACEAPSPVPYPCSPVIASVTFDWSTHRRAAAGSDNWPLTWGDDGHQYTAWGDGWGFDGAPYKVSLGYSRIEGGADDHRMYDVFQGDEYGSGGEFDAKSVGLVSLGRVLYTWVSPGSEVEHWESARLYRSDSLGTTWTYTGVEFVENDGVGYPWILNFGRGYEHARDDYVYHYFIEIKDPDRWEAQRPGEIALARSPIDGLTDPTSYEWFAGLDEDGGASWSREIGSREPVLSDPNGLMRGSIVYNPHLDRYLFLINHTARNLGNIALFDAPEPWGPWTTVLYESGWPEGAPVPRNSFLWHFAPKWWSEDGTGFVMIFTGKGENDAWNSVEGHFELR